MGLELSILMAALVISMATRPWRLLSGGALLTPLLATLVVLPWLWALPRLHTMPLQLQFSGACAVTLMLGWPLAVPVLLAVTLVSGLLAPADFNTLLEQVVWHGLVPATLAMIVELQHVGQGLSLVARWLMAWGDGFMTGMMAAIFVAFRPQWLATWSDRLYLKN